MAEEEQKPGLRQRLSQMVLVFNTTREVDKRLVPLMAAVGLGLLAVFVVLGFVFLGRISGSILGVGFGLLGALMVFGRRATRLQYRMLEGRPGAAAAILQSMRGRWFVTPGVAFTRKQDFVHRVVGRPGVVLVGEGAAAKVSALLKQEKRRHARVAGDVPVHEISVGDREGQVPLGKLQANLQKLPRAVKPRDIADLERRMRAAGGTDMPIPKGPMPRVKRKMM